MPRLNLSSVHRIFILLLAAAIPAGAVEFFVCS